MGKATVGDTMFLRSALNALTRIHSRPGTLKRLGTIDIYSPCRLTPSNYFRNLRGPEYTTIKGVEFIIPVDTMTGEFSQLISFDRIPDAGTFKINFDAVTTTALQFNCTAADVQTALRLLSGLGNVLVTGSFNTGFTVIFTGESAAPDLGEVVDNLLEESGDSVEVSFKKTSQPWSSLLEKGDRITDGSKSWTVDEIIEMHELGAQVMAFRVRCD